MSAYCLNCGSSDLNTGMRCNRCGSHPSDAQNQPATPILDDTGLVERLRSMPLADRLNTVSLHNEAADRILALSADNARMREALEAFKTTAVICEHTHRVTVDEWALSKCRQALSNPLEGDGK